MSFHKAISSNSKRLTHWLELIYALINPCFHWYFINVRKALCILNIPALFFINDLTLNQESEIVPRTTIQKQSPYPQWILVDWIVLFFSLLLKNRIVQITDKIGFKVIKFKVINNPRMTQPQREHLIQNKWINYTKCSPVYKIRANHPQIFPQTP